MKKSKIGAIILGTAIVVQMPFQVFAATTNTESKTETTKPVSYMNNKLLTATSDLDLTVGEAATKSIHLQDNPLSNNEWGSYITDVKVVLTGMDGMDYQVIYGPKSEDGTHYQYADVIISGTPTKAGNGSFSLEYYDGASNGGVYSYTVNTQSTISVKYVDQDGNKIAEDTSQAGDVSTAYTTEPKTIDGYTLDETKLPSNQNGQFGETNQTVTYTYTKNEVNKGTVGISFVSEDGERQELVSILDLSFAYPDGVPSNTVTFGDLAEGATYNDLRKGTLTIDKLWSDVLQNMAAYMNGTIDAAGFEAAVGATPAQFDLDLIAENFEGYEFDEAAYQANLEKMVTFEQNGGNVNLQVPFKKIAEVQAGADVTVKYVDADGNELAAAETLSGNVDENYTSEAKTIDGWTLKETPANASGTFSDQAQTVTYVYEKNADENVTPTPTPVDPDDNNTSTDNTNNTAKVDKASMKNIQISTPDKTITTAKNALPKTGDNELSSSLLVGLGVLMLGGLFIFLRKTKTVK
ncbi:MucBP domain-containing protein [Listeria immobilis]|uniref:MucBP domain-containing protein n=1 Tax=Listeria immobilis TaxID=2713502 RepID=UPI0016282824|nr:MucBP domain-containing protein [Listeria immobilis]MBC1516665.1 MucBP domain-containing protein [Listeria immobilis]